MISKYKYDRRNIDYMYYYLIHIHICKGKWHNILEEKINKITLPVITSFYNIEHIHLFGI
jgi:hypothetical protein